MLARVRTEKMPVKKKRYNWKARQLKRGNDLTHGGSTAVLSVLEYGQSSNDAKAFTDDTNALVLPAKRTKCQDSEKPTKSQPKRRKLSNRQRKRLEKIVEGKEKKCKVCSASLGHSCLYEYACTCSQCLYVRTVKRVAKLGEVADKPPCMGL